MGDFTGPLINHDEMLIKRGEIGDLHAQLVAAQERERLANERAEKAEATWRCFACGYTTILRELNGECKESAALRERAAAHNIDKDRRIARLEAAIREVASMLRHPTPPGRCHQGCGLCVLEQALKEPPNET